jgi:hypothetical protein
MPINLTASSWQLSRLFSRYRSSYSQLYTEDAQPMLFPGGELFSKLVDIDQGVIDAFLESLKLLGRPYKPFLKTLESIQSALEAWFQAASDDPIAYAIPACSYSSIEALAFQAFADGIYPTQPTPVGAHTGWPFWPSARPSWSSLLLFSLLVVGFLKSRLDPTI